MKDVRSTSSRKIDRKKAAGGVSVTSAAVVALLASGGAYYVGDRAGYTRGTNEALTTAQQDPIDKLDCMARIHRAVTLAKKEREARKDEETVKPLPPPPPAPVDLSFHNSLRGKASSEPMARPPDPLVTGQKTLVSTVAKPVEEKPAPSPGLHATPSTGEFALQVGAYPEKAEALKVYEKLKSAGLKPTIVPSELAGSTWYRVRVGRFADRALADGAAKSLIAQVQLSGVPVKH